MFLSFATCDDVRVGWTGGGGGGGGGGLLIAKGNT